jgi:hypothetical protein
MELRFANGKQLLTADPLIRQFCENSPLGRMCYGRAKR